MYGRRRLDRRQRSSRRGNYGDRGAPYGRGGHGPILDRKDNPDTADDPAAADNPGIAFGRTNTGRTESWNQAIDEDAGGRRHRAEYVGVAAGEGQGTQNGVRA